VGKRAALLIVLGGALVLAWLILGIGFLNRFRGWVAFAGGILGAVGVVLLVIGVTLARMRSRA
jgi:hypothetical protein